MASTSSPTPTACSWTSARASRWACRGVAAGRGGGAAGRRVRGGGRMGAGAARSWGSVRGSVPGIRTAGLLGVVGALLLRAVACAGPPASVAPARGDSAGAPRDGSTPVALRDVRLAYVSTASTFAALWAAREYGLLE